MDERVGAGVREWADAKLRGDIQAFDPLLGADFVGARRRCRYSRSNL
jgi:hypothetical protein